MLKTYRAGVAAAAVLATLAGGAQAQTATHDNVTFISGGPTGTWYPTAAAIADLVNANYDGQPVGVTPGKGAVGNPLSVGAGKAGIGLSYGPFLKLAYQGDNEVFPKTGFTNLRAVANVVANTVHIIMSADVDDAVFENLADGGTINIGVGQKGSSNHFAIEKILQAYGDKGYDALSESGSNIVEGAQQGLVDAYLNRQLDIYTNTVGVNAGSVREPASARPSKLLSLPEAIRDRMVDRWGYVKSTIPAGTYPGQDAPAETLDLSTVVFVTDEMDDDLVYNMVKGMAENRDRLVAAYAGFETWQPEDMPEGLPIPIHPGAERYYKERGWLK